MSVNDIRGPWAIAEGGAGEMRHAPATARNREPIAAVLAEILPASGLVLEVASGSGEHAVFLAQRFPQLQWQPSDPDPECRGSIAAWAAASGCANLLPPVALDAGADDWPVARADALLCINMIHISAWRATLGLFAGAGRVLEQGAPLCLYGPFVREGVATAESNRAFDTNLRARNPDWGLRDLNQTIAAAQAQDLELAAVIEMPANNLSVIFRKGF